MRVTFAVRGDGRDRRAFADLDQLGVDEADAEWLRGAIRTHLADDLDSPGALAAVDAWADETLTRRGGTGWSPDAPAAMARAVDALLGVALAPTAAPAPEGS